MMLKPRLYKLSCPTSFMNTVKLKYTDCIQYLGSTFSFDNKDDNDMFRQLRILSTIFNGALRLLHCCSTDVKINVIRSYNYCACLYCLFVWTHYKEYNQSKLRVAFDNVYCCIFKFPSWSSASNMYAVNHIDRF